MNSKPKLIGLANLITDPTRLLREHTNLAYVEPHKVIIGDTLYLFFNEQKHFYIGYFDDERAIGIKIEYLTTLKKYIPNIDKDNVS